MRWSLLPVVTMLLALLPAGCIDDAQSDPPRQDSSDETPPTTSDPTTPDPTPGNETPILFKPGIEWTDCTAFAATASGPAALYPYQPQPPGWTDPPLPGLNQHYLHAAYCQRVQWGPYERGPVFTLFESLAGSLAPDSCLEGETNRYSHMGTLWISDAEIAAYANATLGIPVYAGDFALEETAVESAVEHKWTWGLPGQAKSEFAMVDTDLDAQPSSFIERIFWFNDTTLSFMDVREDYEVPTFQPHMGYGRMEEPMVAASSGVNEYNTPTDTHTNSDWRGTVHTFRDYKCEEPV